MARCVIGQGFFTRRRCKNAAVAGCPSCGRAMCQEHGVTTPSGFLCVDCASNARRGQQPTRYDDDFYDPFLYRSSYWATNDDWLSSGPDANDWSDAGDSGDSADYGSVFDS